MVNVKEILGIVKSSIVIMVVVVLLVGVLIPTVTSLIAENVDPGPANGSQISIHGKIYGSYLLAQAFNRSYFFQPRPSAIDFNQTSSGAPECSPNTNASLNQTMQNLRNFENMNPNVTLSQIPGEMIMDSDSGLDPNIPVQGAILQEKRVVQSIIKLGRLKGVLLSGKQVNNTVEGLINASESQDFPVFGSYYVNVMYIDVGILNFLMDNGIIRQSSLD
ncbi:MAG: potassium-transporting ATPase subunit C [Candidatus Thermoplasmatota archaeon]|jgi:K+-transporting ATPase ATPase C chain|nr:potassium-transporting ATPase subunit C [Candidatus Thermoplasmatota archaeon]MCL5790461.1 potassium-transporting ATPase subunit C [Candidatus Thermoplasmatota archaeon]